MKQFIFKQTKHGTINMNNKTNNFLPIGFEKLKTEKPYINLGKSRKVNTALE